MWNPINMSTVTQNIDSDLMFIINDRDVIEITRFKFGNLILETIIQAVLNDNIILIFDTYESVFEEGDFTDRYKNNCIQMAVICFNKLYPYLQPYAKMLRTDGYQIIVNIEITRAALIIIMGKY